MRRPIRAMANRTAPRRGTVASRVAPPNIMVAGMSTGTGAITARISAGVSLIRQTLERMPDQV